MIEAIKILRGAKDKCKWMCARARSRDPYLFEHVFSFSSLFDCLIPSVRQAPGARPHVREGDHGGNPLRAEQGVLRLRDGAGAGARTHPPQSPANHLPITCQSPANHHLNHHPMAS